MKVKIFKVYIETGTEEELDIAVYDKLPPAEEDVREMNYLNSYPHEFYYQAVIVEE